MDNHWTIEERDRIAPAALKSLDDHVKNGLVYLLHRGKIYGVTIDRIEPSGGQDPALHNVVFSCAGNFTELCFTEQECSLAPFSDGGWNSEFLFFKDVKDAMSTGQSDAYPFRKSPRYMTEYLSKTRDFGGNISIPLSRNPNLGVE